MHRRWRARFCCPHVLRSARSILASPAPCFPRCALSLSYRAQRHARTPELSPSHICASPNRRRIPRRVRSSRQGPRQPLFQHATCIAAGADGGDPFIHWRGSIGLSGEIGRWLCAMSSRRRKVAYNNALVCVRLTWYGIGVYHGQA